MGVNWSDNPKIYWSIIYCFSLVIKKYGPETYKTLKSLSSNRGKFTGGLISYP